MVFYFSKLSVPGFVIHSLSVGNFYVLDNMLNDKVRDKG